MKANLDLRRVFPIIRVLALLLLAASASARYSPDSKVDSFHGCPDPGSYLVRLLESADHWTLANKMLFVKRGIEASVWVGTNRNTDIFDTDSDLAPLARVFPIFRRMHLEEATVRGIGDTLARVYPEVKKSIKSPSVQNVGFRGYASPSAYIEDHYFHLRPKASDREWKSILSIVHQGAIWERRHPDLDYAVQPVSWLMMEIHRRHPGLSIRRTVLGIRVQDMDAALQRVNVRRPVTLLSKGKTRGGLAEISRPLCQDLP
jgi:hypothetical protein